MGAFGGAAVLRQRGNALVYTMLGLALASLAAVAGLQSSRITQKRGAGTTEATILDNLRNAANAAIYEQVVELQAGNPLTKNGVTVAPVLVAGELVWSPTPANLVGMGYLPPGWTTASSMVNNAPYNLRFKRVPAGCAPANCGIEGHWVVSGPIRDTTVGGQVDAVVIGAILTRIGADSGVSLPTGPATITGFGNTWTLPNPVAGTPPGVVAVRVGTASAGFSQFVRIRDARDPDLQGNLTVGGNLAIGGTSTFNGPVNVNTGTNNCVQLLPGGVVNINCTGALNSKTGTFTDGSGNTTSISPGTLATTGSINAGANVVATGNISGAQVQPTSAFLPGTACNDNNAVGGNASSAGLVLCSGGAWRPIVTQSTAGTACAPDGDLAQSDGAALLCRNGVYVLLSTFANTATGGNTCTTIGATAIDLANNGTLLCRANASGGTARWYRLQDMTGNLQFVASSEVSNGGAVYKPACGSTAGYAGQPALIVTPKAEGSIDASFQRFAVDNGASWTVYLQNADGTPLSGTGAGGSATAIAQQYCYYP